MAARRFWWVNQKQTYRHEVKGGYLWSPKRKQNGRSNPFYDFMREVSPGDIVFSYADGFVKAVGVISSHAYEAPKPLEFAGAGAYWEMVGWRVDVYFRELDHFAIRPAEFMSTLAPLLASKYAPLQANGHGQQSMYLTNVSDAFAGAIIDLIGHEARSFVEQSMVAEPQEAYSAYGLAQWEEHELDMVRFDETIDLTQREAIVLARRGQGLFKQNVARIERSCRVTKVDRLEHLRASHCKPWRSSTSHERLDGDNGLLLTPNIDHLFDRGFISFDAGGDLLISPVAHVDSLERLGIPTHRVLNVGRFSLGQERYLSHHRDNVFLKSRFLS